MNSATERFEARVGEHVAFIKFHLRDSTLSLIHAESPTALRGKGVADTLADGVTRARETLKSGAARRKLDEFVSATQSLAAQ